MIDVSNLSNLYAILRVIYKLYFLMEIIGHLDVNFWGYFIYVL